MAFLYFFLSIFYVLFVTSYVAAFYYEVTAISEYYLEQSFLRNKMRLMIFFPNDKTVFT